MDNPFPTNPMIGMILQDKISQVNHPSMFGAICADQAYRDFRGVVQMITDQYADNPRLVTDIVGQEVIDLIKQYNHGKQ